MLLSPVAGSSRTTLGIRGLHSSSVRLAVPSRTPLKKQTSSPLSSRPSSLPTPPAGSGTSSSTVRPQYRLPQKSNPQGDSVPARPSSSAKSSAVPNSSGPSPPKPSQTVTPPRPPTSTSTSTRAPWSVSKTRSVAAPSPAIDPDPIDWPWRPIPLSDPNTTIEERVIFSRPYEGPLGPNPKFLWVFYASPFFFLVRWLTFPAQTEKEKEKLEEMKRSDRSNDRWLAWYTNVAEGFIYVVAFTAAVFSPSITWLQTRIVTRLVQRRIKMKGGETRESVRMITGGSLAFSAKAKGKEFQKNELMIRMLQTQTRAKYLVLQVLRPSFIDRSPLLQKYLKGYRLDFGEANVLRTTEEEVVLSFKRIESVFGSIRAPPSANGRKEPRFGEGLMMFYRRLTGSLSREKKA